MVRKVFVVTTLVAFGSVAVPVIGNETGAIDFGG
jgi:hypothetical protein